ncbi:hypothetical protein FVEN_g5152 [Fusarium venenatum]|uniref:Uncharacterized protein n=1 Tax=Fusarium venenatum TaxID=56646 RepID=A0A2L2T4K7_9HYPO|nr:uncharacterized protein FVRRES_07059 [Fusarium venenatum]KAG8357098.1 hypothetical protein FVEN_g5152 [Fusarium venenatum]KAH6994007.1 hypothetical protein EDB82DRAFT_475763 [Fusarium venenatum]CEI62623.1 unnamed protein product [Fusarium venenatum]
MCLALTTSVPWPNSLPSGRTLTGKMLTTKSSTTIYLIQANDGGDAGPVSVTVTVEPRHTKYNCDSVYTNVYNNDEAEHTVIVSLHYKMSDRIPQECTISVGGDESTQVSYTAGGTDEMLTETSADIPMIITGGLEYLTGSPSTSVAASVTSDPLTEKGMQSNPTDVDITSHTNKPTSTPSPTISVSESEPI